jgi:uncharacterized protein YjbI with pentapeptide repeats
MKQSKTTAQGKHYFNLQKVLFLDENTELQDSFVESCCLGGSQISSSNLDRTQFYDVNFAKNSLKLQESLMPDGVVLSSVEGEAAPTKFSECSMKDLYFNVGDLTGCVFYSCDLSGALFVESDLTGVKFLWCDLTGATFTGCKMADSLALSCKTSGIEQRYCSGSIHIQKDLKFF